MSSSKIIFRARLTEAHPQPGRTEHSQGGVRLGPFTSLAIECDAASGCCFLFYLVGEGITADTWHLTLDDAFHQAEWELGVSRNEWRSADESL